MLDLPIFFFCTEGQTMGSILKVTGDSISHLAFNCLECGVETLATTNRKRRKVEVDGKETSRRTRAMGYVKALELQK